VTALLKCWSVRMTFSNIFRLPVEVLLHRSTKRAKNAWRKANIEVFFSSLENCEVKYPTTNVS